MNAQQPSARLRPFRPQPFGRYTLLAPLSTGGMGEVYLARIEGAQGFEKLCVIKRILPHLVKDPDFVERFVNEAKTLVKLSHGSIAQVLDMGLSDGSPFLALEHVDGKDLRKVAARMRDRDLPLPLTFVLYTMTRVLDALAYAHRKRDDEEREIGLVHRDVSPQNILISYEGEIKVIDFGLAKSTLNTGKTHPSIILGKFLYMSPEQARHQHKVDRRSDLYSVGLVLYEMITGKNPFEEYPPSELIARVGSPDVRPLGEVEPLCPGSVQDVVMKALMPDPNQRFQTAEEFRGRLMACLLEIDPLAGPESATRFMREIFAAEYQQERRMFAALRDPTKKDAETAVFNLRDVAPLSFAPTPRVNKDEPTVTVDGETIPSIVLDEHLSPRRNLNWSPPDLTFPGRGGAPTFEQIMGNPPTGETQPHVPLSSGTLDDASPPAVTAVTELPPSDSQESSDSVHTTIAMPSQPGIEETQTGEMASPSRISLIKVARVGQRLSWKVLGVLGGVAVLLLVALIAAVRKPAPVARVLAPVLTPAPAVRVEPRPVVVAPPPSMMVEEPQLELPAAEKKSTAKKPATKRLTRAGKRDP
jgi:serine/threonine protein kinase